MMADELQTQTQTQTQNSQVEWSQVIAPSIPIIWGRLYRTTHQHCWRNDDNEVSHIEYLDLMSEEFSVGRSLTCDFVMKKDNVKFEIIKNVSKMHFMLKRDNTAAQSPAVLVDCSYNGTFINGVKVGKGKSRVLDDNDEISITHPLIKMFVFKDHQKNEQDRMPREIAAKYYVSRTLGQGACGVVKLVYNKLSCQEKAMKIIKKNALTNAQLDTKNLNNPNKIKNEVNILRQLRHPFIISTEEIYESRNAVYIVMERASHGELFERITRQQKLSERQTRLLFRQMVLAVQYLHLQGITHRDLKPENVLLVGDDDDTVVKISDFGLSKLVGEDTFMRTMCGTPLYLAPEVLQAAGRAGYGPEVDVWSLGVIYFICLSGYLPFSSEYEDLALHDQIMRGRYTFSESHWAGVSTAAKSLMHRMLTVSPRQRITLDKILCHPWMQDEEVINRVNELLRGCVADQLSQLSVNTDEGGRAEEAAGGGGEAKDACLHAKRQLSNDSSSSEPVSKRFRLGLRALSSNKENRLVSSEPDKKSDDTSSAKSYNGDCGIVIV